MKTYLLALLMSLGTYVAFAQSPNTSAATTAVSAPASNAMLEWKTTEQNVGEIPQGTPKEVVFEFTNTGTAPLIIANVRTSCGCTASDWTREPILPGQSSEIKATYNAAGIGKFSKTVTIMSNASTPSVVLKLQGVVVQK